MEEKFIVMQKQNSTNTLLTPNEICDLLKIKMSKFRSMVFRREIKVIKIGRLLRVRSEDLQNLLLAK